jgi:kanosamine 6-kinase
LTRESGWDIIPLVRGFLGIDIGGTKVAMRIEDVAGADTELTFAWAPDADAERDLATLAGQVRTLIARWAGEIGAAGVAMPATLDPAGRVVAWPTRPSWVGADPTGALRAVLPDARITCADDGDLAALAEAGAAGCANVVYLGVGTGVGGGIVLAGRPCPGPSVGSCELGHLIVDRSGPRCDCGRRGCVQAIASGPATLRRAAELRGLPVAPDELPGAVEAKERWAIEAVATGAAGLATAIAGVSELVRPDLAVVGGGFAAAMPGYLDFVRSGLDALRRQGHPLPPVRAARLGGLSSLRGAVELARQQT